MNSSAELTKWCAKTEAISIDTRKEYWNMEVGLPYDQKHIDLLEKQSITQSEHFLNHFKEPADLYDDCIGSLAGSKTYKLAIKLKQARENQIVSKKHQLKGKPVTWQTWRQFAAQASDAARKDVYDEFVTCTQKVAPIVEQRFSQCLDIYEKHGTDPLTSYCKSHRMSATKLREVITQLRDGIKKPFARVNNQWSQTVFGRPPQYYDDFYVLRNKIYEHIHLPKLDPLKSIFTTIKGLGLSPDGILLDAEDRPGKFASPFMSSIQVPTDVRVSYKAENPFNDLTSIYHEYGHALHYKSIKPNLPYWTRNCISEGLAETFSIFFDKLLTDKNFLHHVGFNTTTTDDILRRSTFKDLYAASFYCANSLFKIDLWQKHVPFNKLAPLYAKHVKDCMGLEIPGEYWLLHHILPDSLMYVPSYMLAEMQVANLHQHFAQEHGTNWWEQKTVGKELNALMSPGNESTAANFSKINPKNMIKNLTQ